MTICADCGAEIDPDRGRAFGVSPEADLCWECARRRGGAYDELRDSWVRAPDVKDLIERDD
jgi:hypothetical protein